MQRSGGNRNKRVLVTIVSTLLALALTGVGWASVAVPGPTNFVQIDDPANVGFDGPSTPSSFDWADSGANASPRNCVETPLASGTCTCNASGVCSGNECRKTCNGFGGLFDGGVFHSVTSNPTPPSLQANDQTIAAATFGVDELGISTNVAKVCTVSLGSCIADTDCTVGAGDTCRTCGGGDPTVYTGQGSETNNSDLNSDTYSTATVPNKDDISNVYALAHQNPNPSTGGNTDTNEIFAGFERVVNNGDSHVDLEFLQLPVGLVPAGSCAGGTNAGMPCISDADCPQSSCSGKGTAFPCQGKFSGNRTPGDLLVAVDFTTGGALGTVNLYQWACGNVTPASDGSCNPNGRKAGPHYELNTNPVIQQAVRATVNGATCSASGASCLTAKDCSPAGQTCVPHDVGCGGWACRNASGVETSIVPTNELFEVGVDLAAIGFKGCISTFLPHTRSSQSFTAVLKDFKLLQFNTCAPRTTLTKQVCDAQGMNCASSKTLNVGDSVVYKYTETSNGNVSLTNPHVTDDKCSPVVLDSPSGDANGNGNLDPGETWHFKCSKSNLQDDAVNTALGHGDFKTGSGVTKDVTACLSHCSVTTTQSCYVSVDPNPGFGTIGCPTGEICVTPDPPAGTICDNNEVAQAQVIVRKPTTCLKKSATVTNLSATVLYKYDETNDGQISLTSPSVEDAECTTNGGTITLDSPSGDTNGNSTLDPGETWHFKCTATFSNITQDTNFIDVAKSHGCFSSGGVTKDVTVSGATSACGASSVVFPDADETDTKTVTVRFPTITGGKASCTTP
jgi:hypothetical protein